MVFLGKPKGNPHFLWGVCLFKTPLLSGRFSHHPLNIMWLQGVERLLGIYIHLMGLEPSSTKLGAIDLVS